MGIAFRSWIVMVLSPYLCLLLLLCYASYERWEPGDREGRHYISAVKSSVTERYRSFMRYCNAICLIAIRCGGQLLCYPPHCDNSTATVYHRRERCQTWQPQGGARHFFARKGLRQR